MHCITKLCCSTCVTSNSAQSAPCLYNSHGLLFFVGGGYNGASYLGKLLKPSILKECHIREFGELEKCRTTRVSNRPINLVATAVSTSSCLRIFLPKVRRFSMSLTTLRFALVVNEARWVGVTNLQKPSTSLASAERRFAFKDAVCNHGKWSVLPNFKEASLDRNSEPRNRCDDCSSVPNAFQKLEASKMHSAGRILATPAKTFTYRVHGPCWCSAAAAMAFQSDFSTDIF